MKSKRSLSSEPQGIIAGGFAQLLKGYESAARRIVEDKYAEEWNSSGLLHRWFLQCRMDKEIAELTVETMPEVSQTTLF